MAWLGETRDAWELVPGNPTALQVTVAALDRYGGILERVVQGLHEIDDGGWSGFWADAFHDHFDMSPTGGPLAPTASARWDGLSAYAGTLEWANQAEHAIATWAEGEQATEVARTRHAQSQQRAAPTSHRFTMRRMEPGGLAAPETAWTSR